MTIWRMLRLNGRVAKLRSPVSTSRRAAGSSDKTGRALSWLTGIVLLGSFATFNDIPANAQTSLLDNDAWTERTSAHSRLSGSLATPEATDNTAVPARVAGQGTERDKEENDTAPRRVADRVEPTSGNPLWRLPLKQFLVTRERPIFSPSRRPPAPTYVAPVAVRQPAKPPEPEHPTIALTGTIIGTDGYQMAVFRDTSTQDVLRLHVGENYHGWVVRLISPREARLVKNGEQALLGLARPAGTPPPARSSQDVMLDQVWKVGAE
jgi:hypothetical protein